MAVALVVDKLDAVPEALRSSYVEKEGKFHLDVAGLEDTSGLKSALQKEREANKEAQRALREAKDKYGNIDVEKYNAIMAKFDNDAEAQLIAAGRIDEVISKRTEKFKSELEKQLDAERQKAVKASEVASTFMERVLDNHVRAAAAKAGLHSSAIEDALLRARRMFTLDDNGEAVQLDDNGQPVLGKDGKTPFTPIEWLESMKETAPHWFPAGSSGSGAGGSKDSVGGAKTMARAIFAKLSPVEQSKAARQFTIVD